MCVFLFLDLLVFFALTETEENKSDFKIDTVYGVCVFGILYVPGCTWDTGECRCVFGVQDVVCPGGKAVRNM